MRRPLRRNVLLLSLLGFMVSVGFSAVRAVLPYYVLYLHGELQQLPESFETIEGASAYALQTTALMSVFMLTRALLARYFGSLSDRLGRRRIILSGVLGYFCLSLGYIASSAMGHLYLLRALQGVASAMVWPVAEALLMDTAEPSWRGRAMAAYMVANTLAWTSGPALGAGMYKLGVLWLGIQDVGTALRFPFLGLAVFTALTLPAILFVQERKRGPEVEERDVKPDQPQELGEDPRKSVNAIYVMSLANGISMGFSSAIFSLFIMEFIDADPAAIASVISISGFIGLLASYPAGKASDSVSRKSIVMGGGLVTRILTALFPFSRNLVVTTGLVSARSVGWTFSRPALRALQADLVPERVRGKIFGTVQAMFNVGAVVGPLAAGQLYEMVAPHTYSLGPLSIPGVVFPFFVSAAAGLVGLVVFGLFVKESHEENQAQ